MQDQVLFGHNLISSLLCFNLQVFEVLHYIGSCLLKVIKTKLKKVSKKQRKLRKVEQQEERKKISTDEDPFLASIRRTENLNSKCLHNNEGKLKQKFLMIIMIAIILEKDPCPSSPESRQTQCNVTNNFISPERATNGNFPNVGHIKSLHVKYTNSGQPYR